MGGKGIYLGAQTHAQTFYEQLGYHPCGEIFYDEHCPHIPMEKSL